MIPHCMLCARGQELQAKMTCRGHDVDALGLCFGAPERTHWEYWRGFLLAPLGLQSISAEAFVSYHMQYLQDKDCNLL